MLFALVRNLPEQLGQSRLEKAGESFRRSHFFRRQGLDQVKPPRKGVDAVRTACASGEAFDGPEHRPWGRQLLTQPLAYDQDHNGQMFGVLTSGLWQTAQAGHLPFKKQERSLPSFHPPRLRLPSRPAK